MITTPPPPTTFFIAIKTIDSDTLYRRFMKALPCKSLSCLILVVSYTLKDTAKVPTVDLLRLNTLRGSKTALLTPKRYSEHLCSFYMEVPTGKKVSLVSTHDLVTILYVILVYEDPFTRHSEINAEMVDFTSSFNDKLTYLSLHTFIILLLLVAYITRVLIGSY